MSMSMDDPTRPEEDEFEAEAETTAEIAEPVAAEPAHSGPYVSEDGLTMGRDFVIPGVDPAESDPYRFHTGRKRDQKVYYHHTGYPGGIKERTAKFILDGRFPERVVEKAVERMLPRGPLFRQIMGNLRVYKGTEHPHTAQQPEALDVGALNAKNVRA